ncbi:MAG TPA: hypothetical protein VEZ14_03020 [Dehalococcoidia bacterium]|nr:hypothetical protein [Dehalococcoidia bacterium]
MAGKERSPNFPSLSLPEAVALARAFYEKVGRGTVPSEVAFKAMGYKSASGTAKSHLGALRAYGLVEGTKGNVKISDRALTALLMPSTSADYSEAIRDSALEPPIFRELWEAMPGAFDEALRHHLIVNRKFSADGANRLIRVYRETMEVAAPDKSGYYEPVKAAPAELQLQPVQASSASARAMITTPETHHWRLGPDASADLTVHGQLTPATLGRLKRYIDLLEESLEPEPAPPSASVDETAG